jgi:hypothetical protein
VSPAIDFKALEDALLEQEKPTQAALVRFMADKEVADAEAVGVNVHDNKEASDRRIAKNAQATSDSLAEMGSRLRFHFASGKMHRKISAE